MATIKRFEDLECWQEARRLVNMVYFALNESKDFHKDYRLTGQITGAAISVMNNIVEGWASQSNNEFIRFLTYSRRSSIFFNYSGTEGQRHSGTKKNKNV